MANKCTKKPKGMAEAFDKEVNKREKDNVYKPMPKGKKKK